MNVFKICLYITYVYVFAAFILYFSETGFKLKAPIRTIVTEKCWADSILSRVYCRWANTWTSLNHCLVEVVMKKLNWPCGKTSWCKHPSNSFRIRVPYQIRFDLMTWTTGLNELKKTPNLISSLKKTVEKPMEAKFFFTCKCCSGVLEPQILIQSKYSELLCELVRWILLVEGLRRVQILRVSVKYFHWCGGEFSVLRQKRFFF